LNPLIEHQSTTQGNQLLIGNEINQIEDKLIMLNALYEKDLITILELAFSQEKYEKLLKS